MQQTDAVANIDSKWTQEALFNIVDNAIKYTDSGSITIGVSEYDMFVRIDVCDTGKGIPQEEQTKIFGRFYRGMSVRSEEGVGIGLYLARKEDNKPYNEQGHRRNMLGKNFTRIGIAYAYSANSTYKYYWVMILA